MRRSIFQRLIDGRYLVALLAFSLIYTNGMIIQSAQAEAEKGIKYKKLEHRGRHLVRIEVGGLIRQFIIYVPSNNETTVTKPIPIVFFFHGLGGNCEQAAKTYGWEEKAEAETFYAVFPEALPVRPDLPASFRNNPWMWRIEKGGQVDDIAFFEQLITQLEAVLPIDPNKIYLTGFSNGGSLAFTLAARFSDRIAAVGGVSCDIGSTQVVPHRPLNVLYMTGTQDPLNPIEGGTIHVPWASGVKVTKPAVIDTINQWTTWDACPQEGTQLTDIDGVKKTIYQPGTNGVQVLVYTIDGLGHHWPGTKEPLPKSMCGPIRDPFHATDLIWDFFFYNPLQEAPKPVSPNL